MVTCVFSFTQTLQGNRVLYLGQALPAKQRFLVCTEIRFFWVMLTITALAKRVWTKDWDSVFVSNAGFREEYEGFCPNILCQQSGLQFYLPSLA